MNLLILGGTAFLGRHLTEAALRRGHRVTHFNRGQTNPTLFPDVETLRGDRDAGDVAALRGRRWDAVIDTCAYVPRVVREALAALGDGAEHYTLISTISVFAGWETAGMDESGPLATIEDETTEEVTGETYGALKVLCERAAEAGLPGRVLTIRPGLIVGPHDPTDRFTYWPRRVAQGGAVLGPNRPDHRVEFIDARDLAEWTLDMAEARATGIFNATGPEYPLTLGEVLTRCKAVAGSDATFTWVGEGFLLAHEVAPFAELPLWVPEELVGFATVDCSKAIAAGLRFRPLDETIRDTLAWDATRPAAAPLRAGLSRDREAALLAAWKDEG